MIHTPNITDLIVAWTALFGVTCIIASAQDAPTPVRDERLIAMQQRAESLQLRFRGRDEIYRVQTTPLLRYNDPTLTTTDGALWLWTANQRPAAALCLFMDSRDGFQWNYELAALADAPFEIDGRRDWVWRPEKTERGWQAHAEPDPSGSARGRLTQMKALLADYRGDENGDNGRQQLRLLPRPVYRYSAPAAGVIDGAIFLMVVGTNPEVLVQVEAVANPSEKWRVGFARMSASELTVRRGDKSIWTAAPVRSWNTDHEYYSHYGPDRNP